MHFPSDPTDASAFQLNFGALLVCELCTRCCRGAYEQETRKIILSLDKVSQTSPTGKTLLNKVSLGMYLGAKIGILGANGSGKSTLMNILAAKDTPSGGDMTLDKGIKIGYLEQEPELNNGDTVIENIEPGVAHIRKMLTVRLDRQAYCKVRPAPPSTARRAASAHARRQRCPPVCWQRRSVSRHARLSVLMHILHACNPHPTPGLVTWPYCHPLKLYRRGGDAWGLTCSPLSTRTLTR